jgi:5-methylcytosine-specific restriction protein A
MPRYCLRPGCTIIVGHGYCAAHARTESDRPNANIRQWYRTPRWRALRAFVLAKQPRCNGRGDGLPCGEPTTDADHVVPHRGDPALFWAVGNVQAKCHRCHSAKTGRGQ